MNEISLMMQEDLYVYQLQGYSSVLIEYAKEKAFQYTFINFSTECINFKTMSTILFDLITQQIISPQEIELKKLNLTPNKDKSKRSKELKTLYKLLIKFHVYQFHGLFLLYHFHPKAIDAEEFIQNDLEHLEIPPEILEKNETAWMIAKSQQRFQQNHQNGLSWVQSITKN
jgi:hypothetical protein